MASKNTRKILYGGSRPKLISLNDLQKGKYKSIFDSLKPKVQEFLLILSSNKLLITYVDNHTLSKSASSYKDNRKKFSVNLQGYTSAIFGREKSLAEELFHAHLIMDDNGYLKEIAIRKDGITKFAFNSKNNKGIYNTDWNIQIKELIKIIKKLLPKTDLPKSHELRGVKKIPSKGYSGIAAAEGNIFPDSLNTYSKKKNTSHVNPKKGSKKINTSLPNYSKSLSIKKSQKKTKLKLPEGWEKKMFKNRPIFIHHPSKTTSWTDPTVARKNKHRSVWPVSRAISKLIKPIKLKRESLKKNIRSTIDMYNKNLLSKKELKTSLDELNFKLPNSNKQIKNLNSHSIKKLFNILGIKDNSDDIKHLRNILKDFLKEKGLL